MGLGSTMSNWVAFFKQAMPPKPKFNIDQIPDQTGRVIVVTGGNSGLGYETVKVLLERNAKVYIASRSKDKVDAAIAKLKDETGKEALFLQLDLADLSSIKRSAEDFLSRESALHVLYNNAGVLAPPIDLVTKDGYDLQWGVSVLGHWYFTELLIPALVAGAQWSSDHHARVLTISSSAALVHTLDWGTFKDGPKRRKTRSIMLYNQSKFGNVVVARQVAKRYAEKGIVSFAINPGNIYTELWNDHLPGIMRSIMKAVWLHPVEYGRLTQLYAGTMPEALDHNGEFFIPWARVGRCRKEAYDDELGQRLWTWLEEQIKAQEDSS